MRNDPDGRYLAVACPLCGAPAGYVCRNTGDGKPFRSQIVHRERARVDELAARRSRKADQ